MAKKTGSSDDRLRDSKPELASDFLGSFGEMLRARLGLKMHTILLDTYLYFVPTIHLIFIILPFLLLALSVLLTVMSKNEFLNMMF